MGFFPKDKATYKPPVRTPKMPVVSPEPVGDVEEMTKKAPAHVEKLDAKKRATADKKAAQEEKAKQSISVGAGNAPTEGDE